MTRRLSAAAMVLAGTAVLGITFGERLFQRAPEFERFTSDIRSSITLEDIRAARADLEGLAAAGVEFQTTGLPLLASQLGIAPDRLSAFLQARFPNVVAGVEALPRIAAGAGGLLDVIESEHDRFASADAIPYEGGDARTVPVGLLAAGVALVLLGFAAFSRGRAAPSLALVVGLALVAVPLALSLPQKSSDTDTLNDNLRPVLTAARIETASVDLAVVQAMAGQLTDGLLPEVARRTGVPPQELILSLAPRLPALVQAIANLGSATLRFERIIGTFERNLANYEEIQPTALVPVAWTAIVAGIVAALAGSWALTTQVQVAYEAETVRRRRLFRGRKAA